MKLTSSVAFVLVAVASQAGCIIYEDTSCEPAGAYAPAALFRNPDTGQCEAVGGGGDPYHCEAAVYAAPDWAVCYDPCEDLGEARCRAADGCRAIYTVAEGGTATFAGCWGVAPSGPVRGDACEGLDAYACSRHDDCVAYHEGSTTPRAFRACGSEAPGPGCYGNEGCGDGTHCNAAEVCLPPPGCTDEMACPAVCYGWCVMDEPPPPPPACETLDETGCIGRPADCVPLYEGTGCECRPDGTCECTGRGFVECRAV